MNETRMRSLAKAVTYRATGTCATIAIALAVTGRWPTSLAIGGIELATKILLYWLHERVWNTVEWGMTTKEK